MQTRKLDAQECYRLNGEGGVRKIIEREYDGYLSDFAPGEYGAVELEEEEVKSKQTIRYRMKAAAQRRRCSISFFKTKGNRIRFRLDALEPWPITEEAAL